MRRSESSTRRIVVIALALSLGVIASVGVALAAGAATGSKATVKIRCPRRVASGRRVTCRLFGRLPSGPRGLRGRQGAKGPRGPRGKTGAPGVSGYEIVSKTFAEVAVPNSGAKRGMSEVETLSCPSGKRAVSGGYDLGTNEAQGAQQGQVTVSLSAPNGNGSGWSVQLFNTSTTNDTSIDLKVYATCAKVS